MTEKELEIAVTAHEMQRLELKGSVVFKTEVGQDGDNVLPGMTRAAEQLLQDSGRDGSRPAQQNSGRAMVSSCIGVLDEPNGEVLE